MNLEDHIGDILRKARMMADVSIDTAARVAGGEADALRQLEQTGRVPKNLELSPLANQIGLNADKLAGIVKGWLPAKVEVSRWRQLRVITTADEDMTVNCFLIWDESNHEAALFDTGFDVAPVVKLVETGQLDLKHIFITHGHSDHVDGLPELSRRFPNAVVHWDASHLPYARPNVAGECVEVGRLRVTHGRTPGHAPDGITYLVRGWPDGAPTVAIVGDALFAGSMGRALGARELAKAAVQKEILSLAPETLICPGHGPLTTVGEEVAHNPFF